MQIQQAHRNATEYVWLGMFATGNSFISELGTGKAPINLRGVVCCLDRGVGAADAPVGARITIGAPLGTEQRFALGPLASELWLDPSQDADGDAINDIVNIWVLVQVYGFIDRVWISESQTTADLYLSTIAGLPNGCFTMTKEASVSGQQRLDGAVTFTVSSVPQTITLDFSGQETLDSNGGIVGWASLLGRTEASVNRHNWDTGQNKPVEGDMTGPAGRQLGFMTSESVTQISDSILFNRGFTAKNGGIAMTGNWLPSGDFVVTGGVGRYTHSSGAGFLMLLYKDFTQVEVDAELRRFPVFRAGTTYQITYDIISPVADAAANLGLEMGVFPPVNLNMAAGTHTTNFVPIIDSWGLRINGVSTSGSFDIDNIAIRRLNHPWTTTGDFALDPQNQLVAYAHSTGAGTLTQSSANFADTLGRAKSLEAGKSYTLQITFSGVTGSPTLSMSGIVGSPVAITVANGTQTVRFTVSSSPGNFVLTAASSGGDAFNITSCILSRYIVGDVTDKHTLAPANIGRCFLTHMGVGGQGA